LHNDRSRLILLLAAAFLLLASCSANKLSLEDTLDKHAKSEDATKDHSKIMSNLPKKELPTAEITVSAVGDILIHERVYKDAKVENGYDFRPMLESVSRYMDKTDISFANQETMIGGTEIGLSTYPVFNSPHEVGDVLKEAGVNIVSIANNHTLDRGEEAIRHAIGHWDRIGMAYVGAYRSESDRDRVRVMETDAGIAVAFLAYTYGTNGIPVPDGKDYLVNLIDKETIALEIEKAKKEADAIIISLHFGNEYERMPSKEQKGLVQFAADEGVDVVLGTHPHVLQPVEWVEGKNGNQTLVAYSLGNFLSGQAGLYRQIGGILTFKIKKQAMKGEEKIWIHSPQFLITYNASENERNYRVLPMSEVTDAELSNARKIEGEIEEHMSQWMPELQFID